MMHPKVYLTQIQKNHIQKYIHFSTDPELVNAMGWQPFDSNEKQRFLDTVSKPSLPGFSNGESIIYGIVTTKNDIPIGFVCLKGINWEEARAEMVIAICDSQYRSSGYGSEALSLAINHSFCKLQLVSISLSVFPSNTRAIRLYEKIGFRHVNTLQNAWLMPDGQKIDMLVMQKVQVCRWGVNCLIKGDGGAVINE